MYLGHTHTEKLTERWEKKQPSTSCLQGEKRAPKRDSKVRGGEMSPKKWDRFTLVLVLHWTPQGAGVMGSSPGTGGEEEG